MEPQTLPPLPLNNLQLTRSPGDSQGRQGLKGRGLLARNWGSAEPSGRGMGTGLQLQGPESLGPQGLALSGPGGAHGLPGLAQHGSPCIPVFPGPAAAAAGIFTA